MPSSGCGFIGVNIWLLIAHLNWSEGKAAALEASATPQAAPMNSRRFSMEPPWKAYSFRSITSILHTR